jgi:hypothetical protein
MTSTLRYLALCLAGLAAACGDEGNDPTTPTSVTVSVDPHKLPSWGYAHGIVTISAVGASNSPQTIWVEKNPWGGP